MLYISMFVTNPEFQWQQNWVRWITGKFCFFGPNIFVKRRVIISPNIFTNYRFIGGFIAAIISWYNPWLGILIFILGALTDWFDGKVVKYLEEFVSGWAHDKKMGAILDGMADKFYVVPPLWDWGKSFFYHPLMVVYVFLALTGYLTLGYVKWKRGSHKDENIYEHLWIGKMKFGLQLTLVGAVWVAKNFSPLWMWWPFLVNLTFGIITVLEFFSIARKIKPEFNRFSADAVSLGNLIYGLLAIYYAWRGEFFFSAASIIVGAMFDLADGYVARKTKGIESKIGKFVDVLCDFITFAFAPAALMYYGGARWEFALIYFAGTAGRLIYYNFKSGKDGIFDGLPSTAAAVFIASLFLWKNIPVEYLEIVAIACAILEILFIFQWYHFKCVGKLSNRSKFFVGLFLLLAIAVKFLGEGISILFFCYLFLFLKPVADKIWKWE